MRILFCAVVVSFVIIGSASAAVKVGVLELVNDANLPQSNVDYLTDKIRSLAREKLLSSKYIILTKENVRELLPDGVNLADCEASDCEVEYGRKLGVDYVVTGTVLLFDKELRISVKLHHSESGEFLREEPVAGKSLIEIEENVRPALGPLFEELIFHAKIFYGGIVPPTDPELEVVAIFSSNPEGALVEIDGVSVGRTQCSVALQMGLHQVSMKLPDHHSVEARLNLNEEMHEVSWILEPITGTFTIRANDPRGNAVKAPVFVAGGEMGITFSPISIIVGNHEVRVQNEMLTWSGNIEVQADRHTVVDVSLLEPVLPEDETARLRRLAQSMYRDNKSSKAKRGWVLIGLAMASGSVAVYEHSLAEKSYSEYGSSSWLEQMDESYSAYEKHLTARNVAIGVSTIFILWRIVRELRSERSADQIFNELVEDKKQEYLGLRMEAQPTGDGGIIIMCGAAF